MAEEASRLSHRSVAGSQPAMKCHGPTTKANDAEVRPIVRSGPSALRCRTCVANRSRRNLQSLRLLRRRRLRRYNDRLLRSANIVNLIAFLNQRQRLRRPGLRLRKFANHKVGIVDRVRP